MRFERCEQAHERWRVLAGPADAPDVLGFLEPAYRSGRRRGWHTVTENLIRLSGGPWKTRSDATVRLLTGRAIKAHRG